MKKYIFLAAAVFFLFSLSGEAQRRSSERSESKSKVEKSSNEKSQATRSSSRSTAQPATKSSPAAKPASRSSSSARPASRQSSSAARPAQSRSSSSREAVRPDNNRGSSAVRSQGNSRSSSAARPQNNSNRSSASQSRSSSSSRSNSAVRPSGNSNSRNQGSTVTSRTTTTRRTSTAVTQPRRDDGDRSRGTSARPVKSNPAPARVENRNSRSGTVYHSTRRYVHSHPVRHVYVVPPRNREYRAVYFPYRRPARVHFHWSVNVFRFYVDLYPVMRSWTYYPDYRFDMISAYDALFHIGELQTVYGKVRDVYYAYETDELFLYFGAYYPYHDFTVVLPGDVARRFSRNPARYFDNDHVMVTGLITEFEGKPEIVVKHPDQIRRY